MTIYGSYQGSCRKPEVLLYFRQWEKDDEKKRCTVYAYDMLGFF